MRRAFHLCGLLLNLKPQSNHEENLRQSQNWGIVYTIPVSCSLEVSKWWKIRKYRELAQWYFISLEVTPFHPYGQGETKERGRPFYIGRWPIYQARELMRLVLGDHRMSRSLPAPHRQIVKICIQTIITWFSHILSPDGLNNSLLSQSFVLKNSSHCGTSGKNIHSKDRGGD